MIYKKRATEYGLALLIIVTLIALITATIALNSKIKEFEPIGDMQYKLINTYDNGEKILFYIDESAKQASYKAVKELADSGGLYVEECGYYFGARLLVNQTKVCIPEKNSAIGSFQTLFNSILNNYLLRYPLMTLPANNYNYEIIENGNIIIEGQAIENIDIPILDIELKKLEVKYKVPPNAEGVIKKIVETYGEKIREESAKNNVDMKLVVGVIAQESKGDPNIISKTGCAGLMQFCYTTAQDYSTFFNKLTVCCPHKTNCKTTSVCSINNDDRFDWEKSIEAGALYLSRLEKQFGRYSYKREFAIASYNGGAGVVNKAIEKTGKSNPTWNQVAQQITPDTISYFNTYSQKEDKVEEIIDYVNKVSGYIQKYEEIIIEQAQSQKEVLEEQTGSKVKECCVCQPACGSVCSVEIMPKSSSCTEYAIGKGGVDCDMTICAPDTTVTSIGEYTINPSFVAQVDYDLKVFDKIYAALKELNEKYQKSNDKQVFMKNIVDEAGKTDSTIKWSDDCEDDSEKAFYQFAEQNYLCSKSINDNCYCTIDFSNNGKNAEILIKNENNNILFSLDDKSEEIKKNTFGRIVNSGIEEFDSVNMDIIQTSDGYQVTTKEMDQGQEIKISYPKTEYNIPFLIYKNNTQLLFLNPSTYSSKLSEYENGKLNMCKIIKDTVKLCVNSGEKIPVYNKEAKKVAYETYTISFAYHFKDIIPPKIVENIINDQNVPLLNGTEAIIRWTHENEDIDTAKFNVYYAAFDFSSLSLNNIDNNENINKIELRVSDMQIFKSIDLVNPAIELIQPSINNYEARIKYDAVTLGYLSTAKSIIPLNNRLYGYTQEFNGANKTIYFVKLSLKIPLAAYHILIASVDNANNNKIGADSFSTVSLKDTLAPATYPLKGFDFTIPDTLSSSKASLYWFDKPRKNIDGSDFNQNELKEYHVYYKENELLFDDVKLDPPQVQIADKNRLSIDIDIQNYDSNKKYCFYVVPVDNNGNKQFSDYTQSLSNHPFFFRPKCTQ